MGASNGVTALVNRHVEGHEVRLGVGRPERLAWLAVASSRGTVLALAASVAVIQSAAAGALTLYVRPNGNDAWSGRLAQAEAGGTDGPVATLTGARDALRRMRLHGVTLAAPVRVLFADGTYPIAPTVVFTPEDSGTADCPITFAAADGAKPVLSGAIPIPSWQKNPSGQYWTATLPEGRRGLGYFRELFVDGRRAIRARYPNQEDYWFFLEKTPSPNKDGVAIYRDKAHLANWPDLSEIEIVLFRMWDFNRMFIKQVDENKRELRLTLGAANRIDRWQTDRRFYLENSLRFLDSPGEWFLDRKRGLVHLRPFDEASFPKAVVVAPAVDRLIRFEGQPQKNVAHLRFEGLTFSFSDWSLPAEGYCGHQGDVETGAAIEGDFVTACEFRKCRFTGLGRCGLWLREGCRQNRIWHIHVDGAPTTPCGWTVSALGRS